MTSHIAISNNWQRNSLACYRAESRMTLATGRSSYFCWGALC